MPFFNILLNMSGHSSSTPCPNCGKSADLYTDYKPYDYSSIQCSECGLMIYPVVTYMNLDELNEYRLNSELEPLEVLPEQSFKD